MLMVRPIISLFDGWHYLLGVVDIMDSKCCCVIVDLRLAFAAVCGSSVVFIRILEMVLSASSFGHCSQSYTGNILRIHASESILDYEIFYNSARHLRLICFLIHRMHVGIIFAIYY